MTRADVRYERYLPTPALADYVEHFWTVSAHVGPVERRELLIPNGRPTVLVNLGDAGRRLDTLSEQSICNDSGFAGIMTRPVIIGQNGTSQLVAAQLSPFGLAALECPPLIDQVQYLEAWCGAAAARQLHDDLTHAPFGEPAARLLETCLAARLKPLSDRRVARLKAVIDALDTRAAVEPLTALAKRLGISYDRLYRDFRKHIGITPKTYEAITRYQRLIGGLVHGQMGDGMAQMAALEGYYDQAHANRDFRRFTGVTPTTFRKTLNGIAKLMHKV